MKNWKWWIISAVGFLSAGLVIFVVLQLFFTGSQNNVAQQKIYSGLPIMKISLNDVTLEEIDNGSKETKYVGNTLNLASQKGIQKFENVQISGRGNSTWIQPKKPYNLKFEKKVDLLGIGKTRKWVLLANFLDDTQLRNDIAYYIGRMLGEEWEQKGEFVELYIDDDYRGLYYLAQKIEIGKGLIDLKDPLGVLVELENLHDGEEICYVAYDEKCMIVKDLVDEGNMLPAMHNFLEDFNEFAIAAEKGDYKTVARAIDVESFAKYYLVSEFTSNPDAYNTSWYFYKDGLDDKIHSGVYWDYDLALANARWGGSKFFLPDDVRTREKYAFGYKYYSDGEYINTEADTATSKLVYYLMRMPEFKEVVENIFAEKMCGRGNELLNFMERRTAHIDEAKARDLARWDKDDASQELEKLTEWVMKRYQHFEDEYGNNCPNYDINIIET